MMKYAKGLGAAAVAGVLLASAAGASLVVKYEFTGGALAPSVTDTEGWLTSVTDLAAVGQGTWATTGDVTDRAFLSGDIASDNVTISLGTSAGGGWRSGSSGTGAPGSGDLTTPSTVNRAQYFGFTVTPDEPIVLQTISLDFWKPSNTADRGVSIWYNYQGGDFDTNSTEAGWLRVLSTTTAGAQAVNFSFDIAGNTLISTPVEFRIYNVSGSSNAELRYDNIMLTAIPEPGTLGLALLGIVAFVIRRRLRR